MYTEIVDNYYLLDFRKDEDKVFIDLYLIDCIVSGDSKSKPTFLISQHFYLSGSSKDEFYGFVNKVDDINTKFKGSITSFNNLGPRLYEKLRSMYFKIEKINSRAISNAKIELNEGIQELVRYLGLLGIAPKPYKC